MATFAAEPLATESYSNLMPLKKGSFKIVEVSSGAIKIGEDGIQNTVSINWAATPPSGKFAKQIILTTPDEPVAQQDDRVAEDGGRATAE